MDRAKDHGTRVPRMKPKQAFTCFCGAVCVGQQAKTEHMLKVHQLKYGYQNVGKRVKPPTHWRHYQGKTGKGE
jgi:hypothetical protein